MRSELADIDRFGIAWLPAMWSTLTRWRAIDSITMPNNSALARLPVTERLTSNQGSFFQVGRVASFIRKQNYNFAIKMHRDLHQVVNKTGKQLCRNQMNSETPVDFQRRAGF